MSYDDRFLGWREANVPFITNSESQTIIHGYDELTSKATVTPTELHRVTIAARCFWDEVRICSAICLNFSHNNTVGRLIVKS